MSVEILFLMDPLERIHPAKDTTYSLIRAALRRGHEIYFAEAWELDQQGGVPWVRCRPIGIPDGGEGLARIGSDQYREVSSFPLVWMRPDPPFDEAYLETTWILERVDPSRCRVVNDPVGVRAANEKLYALHFPELCPTTLVTRSVDRLAEFVRTHGEVVLKPLGGHAGAGILFAQEGMRGLRALLEVAVRDGRCEAQVYLPEAREGDKRILLLDGEPLGAVLRLHGPGEERNNLHLGGSALASTIDEADRRIIETVKPKLREDGLVFVGLDVIGGKLTEVNVTSPTGIQEIESFDGEGASERVIEWCEKNAPR